MKFKKLTQADFDLYKSLLSSGLQINVLAKAVGRAWNTLSKVKQAGTLAEYRELVRTSKNREKNGEQEKKSVVVSPGKATTVSLLTNILAEVRQLRRMWEAK